MKDEQAISAALDRYADTVRRICFLHLKNYHDAEDVFQEVFLKYALHSAPFESCEHEKAWLIRVSINACKDILKNAFKRNVSYLEDLLYDPSYIQEENKEILNTVLNLPEKYRIAVYMVYYEGYTVVEIAKILGKKENTVYSWLTRGKDRLKADLGGDIFEQ